MSPSPEPLTTIMVDAEATAAVYSEINSEMKDEVDSLKDEIHRLEKEVAKHEATNRSVAVRPSTTNSAVSIGVDTPSPNSTDLGTFNVSWYGADCAGCSGITSSGYNVTNTITYDGMGVAAADWSVIPPYSIIEVEGYGRYIVLDKGGAIKGSKLDLLTTSEAKSSEYGRQYLNVKLIRRGK